MKFIQHALLVMAWFSALTLSAAVQPQQLSATLKLKTPGNAAKEYTLALVAVFDPANANSYSIMRSDEHKVDVLTTHTEGQVILSGKTSVGHLGFTNVKGKSALTFGFPYAEAPKDLQLTYNEEDI